MKNFLGGLIPTRIVIAALALISACNAAMAQSSQPQAWIGGPYDKIHQDATTPGTQTSLRITAARNEFESFQVHVWSGSGVNLAVTVSDFVPASGGASIASASNVFLYREDYLNIVQASDANGDTGFIPDILVPTYDPYHNEARTAAWTIAANRMQSVWVDVRVPADAQPGLYTAVATARNGSQTIATLNITLRVRHFTLPSTASLRSAFGASWNALCVQAYGGYNGCAQYPGANNNSDTAIELIHRDVTKLLLDHRISNSGVIYVGPPSGTWTHFDQTYGDLLDGTANTLLSGAKLTGIQFLPPNAYTYDAATIQDWTTHFSAKGWLGALFHYTCDEPPSGCSWADAQTNIHTVVTASSSMKPLITTDLADATAHGLLTDLRIITPIVNSMEPAGGSNQRASYDTWLSGTDRHLWWYQACPSHGSCSNGTTGPATATWPSYMVDASAIRNRVFQWFAYLDRIEGELYYQIDYCWVYQACGPNSDSNNPLSSIYAFGGNGDGTLVYPGLPTAIGGTTPIAIPSIRLKHIRDGMEDFEYLHALSLAGQDVFARGVAGGIITDATHYTADPAAFTAAREKLGDQLDALNGFPFCQQHQNCAHDFNGDGKSDIMWSNSAGDLALWLMNGGSASSVAGLGNVGTNWSIVGQRDFNSDSDSDILWRSTTGDLAMWLMNGVTASQVAGLGNVPTNWSVVGTADFNGDGKGDILWRDTSGNMGMWLMNGVTASQVAGLGNVGTTWSVVGTADFNGDGKADILWRDTSGYLAMWLMNGTTLSQVAGLGTIPTNWSVVGTADFNGDGKGDILWRDTSGNIGMWLMNGVAVSQVAGLGNVGANWSVASNGDYNGDGYGDILWRSASGDIAMWTMNGITVSQVLGLGNIPTNWTIQNANAN